MPTVLSTTILAVSTLAVAALGPALLMQPAETKPKAAAVSMPREEQETFLQTARIINRQKLSEGSTGSWKMTLSDGRLSHDAHFQAIDIYRPLFRGKSGTIEKNFRDSWKYNVAAYRLGKLLGLDMIPPSVEREVDGTLGAMTWWADNIWITEVQRRDRKIKPPATQEWLDQLNKVKVFDQLIYNTDRNQGNLLITPEWRLWMIDHTRAFRTERTLLKPDVLSRVDQTLLENMRKLDMAGVRRDLGPWLREEEMTALLARRDAIVKFFEGEIQEKGQDAVLSGMPRTTPVVSVP